MAGDIQDPEQARAPLQARIAALIARLADGGRDDDTRDALLDEVLAWQARAVAPYARLCARHDPTRTGNRFPALPTDVFRFVRVAAHPEAADTRVFRTSGTTSGARGQHFVRDLSLYDAAARAAAAHALFPDGTPMRIVAVLPPASAVPDSSLSYMVDRFFSWFGDGGGGHVLAGADVDVRALVAFLEAACTTGTPVALLGTSFGLVHADDALSATMGAYRFALPPGSRVMQTGGFKGKSRTLSPSSMRAMLCDRYGVPESHVVQEYGMTELCSQMYSAGLRATLVSRLVGTGSETQPSTQPTSSADSDSTLWVPGWMRATPVDPETLTPVPSGDVGLLRIDDLANLDSVCAIQTSDLARVTPDGLQLLGRAPGAVPRGCSLAVEEALDNG